MGKITLTEAEGLIKRGVLSKTAFSKMQKDGLVGTRKRGEKRYIKTAENTWVTPQFYFQGLNKKTESDEMKTLRQAVNDVIMKHTVTKQK
jgi:hypothetical protein|tara:strand:+ start:289 stop:558 length:270 start_codon:yes stop_codon:yes gene_type:complete